MQQPFRDIEPGPFRADQIRDGDYYELSNGHAIQCMPGGRDHADCNLIGAKVISTDPDVEWAGVDAGYSLEPGTLRAPDVAVGAKGTETGWIEGAPALALEYAGSGQDEEKLTQKIKDLLQFGTKYIWVVRLVGPRRVEVYEPSKAMRRVLPGDVLTAPGVLRNPVPVNALYDREAAHEVTLRNLLQRQGYASLEAVKTEGKAEGKTEGKAEGKAKGKAEAILAVLASRGLGITAQERLQILGCISDEILQAWLMRVSHISFTAELFQ